MSARRRYRMRTYRRAVGNYFSARCWVTIPYTVIISIKHNWRKGCSYSALFLGGKSWIDSSRDKTYPVPSIAFCDPGPRYLRYETPRTRQPEQFMERAGFLVSRSLTLPAAPPWAAGVIRWILLCPKKGPRYLVQNLNPSRHCLALQVWCFVT